MVETLSMVYKFAEKLVQVNIKQEGVIKLLEEKIDSMERERRVEVAERDRRNIETCTTIVETEDSFF